MKFNDHVDEFIKVVKSACFYKDGLKIEPDQWYSEVALALIKNAKTGSKVYFLGNGASAGMSSHFANDFTKNGWVPSLTLTDPGLLTCFSNDYSYETAFSEMLKRFLITSDSLLLISSSGNSPNVVSAAKYFKENSSNYNGRLISFSGFSEQNKLLMAGGYSAWVNSQDYGMVESAHSYLLHILIDLICDLNKREENCEV